MGDWKTLSSEDIYETPWIKVKRDKVLNHAGKELTYSYVTLQSRSVFIVALNAKNELLLQRSYRYTIDKQMWGLPAGHTDGQPPLEAAKKELLEEAGLISDDWNKLGDLYQAVGIGNIPADFFVARNVMPAQHEDEVIEQILDHRFVPLPHVDEMVRNGEFAETTVLAALYLAKTKGFIKEDT